MSLFGENSAFENEPAFRMDEDSRLEEKPEEVARPDVSYAELEDWYRALDNMPVAHDMNDPILEEAIRDLRDEIYSHLRG